jgi:hypothetical protein
MEVDMIGKHFLRSLMAMMIFFPALVGNAYGSSDSQDMKEKISKLEQELADLKKKMAEQEEKNQKYAISDDLMNALEKIKVNDWISKMRFFGYGEVHANFPRAGLMSRSGTSDEIDPHRLVLGWGYDFTESIRFSTEIDFEHAASEMELEYLQLDIDLMPNLMLRVGSLLMPVGKLNEHHEPTIFYSVERPYVENSIIPTTWQEVGVGIVGNLFKGLVDYKLYVVNGLDAEGFTTLGGIRGGRSRGVNAKADDLAFVGRIEYSPIDSLTLGTSLYFGGADQDNSSLGNIDVTIVDLDFHYKKSDFEFGGSFVRIHVSDAAELSNAISRTIGEDMQGWYLEAAYHLKSLLFAGSSKDLVLFCRREEFDTNYDVPSGFVRDGRADRSIWTVGVAYYPIPFVAFKLDFEFWEDDTGDDVNRINLGFAFVY